MYETLLGTDGFRRGMDLYFARHDGTAATCDDFRAAMSDANPPGLPAQFEEWYLQAGTPTVKAEMEFDAGRQEVTLTLTQACGPTPGQAMKRPFLIPCAVGLLHPSSGADVLETGTEVLQLTEPRQSFVLPAPGCGGEAPVLSFLRQFSAPVRASVVGRTVAETAFLMAHDSDSCETSPHLAQRNCDLTGGSLRADNQWSAAQELCQLAVVESDVSDEAQAAFLDSVAALLDSVTKRTNDPRPCHAI